MNNKISSFLLSLLLYGSILIFLSGCKKSNETNAAVTDKDGNEYTAVTIGAQTWLTENLKTTMFSDGTAIPLISDAEVWSSMTTPGYQWYNNDQAAHKDPYGALYNWYTVNTGKLCPDGWHVPTAAEWTTLITYLLGEETAGGKLKESGLTHWKSPNTDATNESGFTALPGGEINPLGIYYNLGYQGNWWTSSAGYEGQAYGCEMWYSYGSSLVDTRPDSYGYSVRCLKN